MHKFGLDTNILIKFIIKAKQNTYASAGERGEKILTDGSKALVYTLCYHGGAVASG